MGATMHFQYPPELSLMSIDQSVMASSHISDHRLCRFAKVSWHHAISPDRRLCRFAKISTGSHPISLLLCISVQHIRSRLSIVSYHQLCNDIKYRNIMVSHLAESYELRNVSIIIWQMPRRAKCHYMPKQAICQTCQCRQGHQYMIVPVQAICRSS